MNELIKLSGLDVLKKEVEKQLSEFELIEVIDDDSYKGAKKQRASLNKLSTEVDKERKRLAKELKTKVDDIIGLVNLEIETLDTRTTTWENELKIQRQNDIFNLYNELKIPVELERIQNDKWLNQTFEWEKELRYWADKIERDLSILPSISTDEKYRELYLECLDLAEAKKLYDIEFSQQPNKVERTITFMATEEEYQKVLDFIKGL
jgi:hypothetical protein